MKRHLVWLVPAALFLIGMAVAVAGFMYDVAFAGIPFQDPTPAMAANYAHHRAVAERIMLGGAVTALAGAVGLIAVAAGRRRTGAIQQSASRPPGVPPVTRG